MKSITLWVALWLISVHLIVFTSGEHIDSIKYYISTTGSDSNSGTSHKEPLETLSYAVSLAKQNLQDALMEDTWFTFYMLPGVYTGIMNIGLMYDFYAEISSYDDQTHGSDVEFNCQNSTIERVAFLGTSQLHIHNVRLVDCDIGVQHWGTSAGLQVQDSIFLRMKEYAVLVDQAKTVNIKASNFSFAPIKIANVSQGVDFDGSIFTDGSYIDISISKFGSIVSSIFQHIHGVKGQSPRALTISGGHWNLHRLLAEHCSYQVPFSYDETGDSANGGAFYLTSAEGSPGKFDLDTDTFKECNCSSIGGAVFVENAFSSISSCQFLVTTGGYGGGLALNNATVSIDNTVFTSCQADYGGGMSINGHTKVEFFNVEFAGNSAYDGSAVDCCSVVEGCATVVSVFEDSLTLSGNTNSAGSVDITCELIVDQSFSEAVTSGQYAYVETFGDSNWWIWFLTSLAVLFAIGFLIVIGSGILGLVKRYTDKPYQRVE